MADINTKRLKNSRKTDRLHIQNLKTRHARKNISTNVINALDKD